MIEYRSLDRFSDGSSDRSSDRGRTERTPLLKRRAIGTVRRMLRGIRILVGFIFDVVT
jgi:hypothetical protein